SFAGDSSSPASNRVKPASAWTSRRRSISTTLSIKPEYFSGGVPKEIRRSGLFFAGSGVEKSFHSGSFNSFGVRVSVVCCSRTLRIAAQICASVYGSYFGCPLRASFVSLSDSTSSKSAKRSCSTSCSSGSDEDGIDKADRVRANHTFVAPRVIGIARDWHSSNGATRRCGCQPLHFGRPALPSSENAGANGLRFWQFRQDNITSAASPLAPTSRNSSGPGHSVPAPWRYSLQGKSSMWPLSQATRNRAGMAVAFANRGQFLWMKQDRSGRFVSYRKL